MGNGITDPRRKRHVCTPKYYNTDPNKNDFFQGSVIQRLARKKIELQSIPNFKHFRKVQAKLLLGRLSA
jgi:hypothetical protein